MRDTGWRTVACRDGGQGVLACRRSEAQTREEVRRRGARQVPGIDGPSGSVALRLGPPAAPGPLPRCASAGANGRGSAAAPLICSPVRTGSASATRRAGDRSTAHIVRGQVAGRPVGDGRAGRSGMGSHAGRSGIARDENRVAARVLGRRPAHIGCAGGAGRARPCMNRSPGVQPRDASQRVATANSCMVGALFKAGITVHRGPMR